MDIIEAISKRSSIRAFLDKAVAADTIHSILDTARWAPSAVNSQPWQIVVVQGQHKQQISEKIIAAMHNQEQQRPDYNYYPATWIEPYKSRRKQCGADLYSALDITWSDQERRKQAWYQNYHFFGAPVGLLFFIHQQLAKGSWVDMGMFLQNVMLSALHYGLATCPQASLAEYPDLVREVTKVDACYHLVCGMALGYPDLKAAVNNYRTARIEVDSFTTWLD